MRRYARTEAMLGVQRRQESSAAVLQRVTQQNNPQTLAKFVRSAGSAGQVFQTPWGERIVKAVSTAPPIGQPNQLRTLSRSSRQIVTVAASAPVNRPVTLAPGGLANAG